MTKRSSRRGTHRKGRGKGPRKGRKNAGLEEQGTFGFVRRGGARKGAGRKRKAARPQVSHRTRARVTKHDPMHVTVRLVEDVPSLRTEAARGVVQDAIERANARGRIRVVHYSVQRNHLHLIVEADDRAAMSNGMQGLLVSLARRLNGLLRRAGRVFADRYHDVVLRTPTAVRNALAYVLNNHLRHDRRRRPVDPFSSSAWFDRWRQALTEHDISRAGREVVARARSWLLGVGWRRSGLIDVGFAPGRPG